MSDKAVTIYDIAKKTNFSAVTVHRALSNKGRISEKTKALILQTAEEMGYSPNPAAQGLRRNAINIGAILFCPIDDYVDDIISGIKQSGSELKKYNVTVDIQKIPYTSNRICLGQMCEYIEEYIHKKYDGIIIFASSLLEELSELSAILKTANENNISIATVANDLPIQNKIIHVGVNAFTAGMTAAELLEFSCKGKEVAVLTTGKSSPINSEYIDGFISYSKNSVFSSVKIYEHFDDKDKISEITERMLLENPDLRGVYITSASSVLACKCIEQKNRSDLSIITTDLLSETPVFLRNHTANATIFQNPFKQGKTVTRAIYNYITSKRGEGTHLINPHIILSSNLDSYLFEKK